MDRYHSIWEGSLDFYKFLLSLHMVLNSRWKNKRHWFRTNSFGLEVIYTREKSLIRAFLRSVKQSSPR